MIWNKLFQALQNLLQALLALAQVSVMWVCSIGYHLWRVGTGRPYYTGIADTWFSVASFATVFLVAATARWYGYANIGIEASIANILISIGVILLFSARNNQSNALTCALLASSAIVDTFACVSVQLGLFNEPRSLVFFVWEIALYISSMVAFYRQSPQVRRSGFRRELT
jgi:hypothetical protein